MSKKNSKEVLGISLVTKRFLGPTMWFEQFTDPEKHAFHSFSTYDNEDHHALMRELKEYRSVQVQMDMRIGGWQGSRELTRKR